MPKAIPNIKHIFAEALKFDSVAERHAYLEDACRDNTQLRTEVESLLAAHDLVSGWAFERKRSA